MKRSDFLFLFYTAITLFIPLPGRLAYGLPVLLVFNLLVLAGTFLQHLGKKYLTDFTAHLCLFLAIIAIAVFLRQLLILYSPLVSLTLGILLYATVIPVFWVQNIFICSDYGLKNRLQINMSRSAWFSLYTFGFFFIRDFFGFGTISFPVPSGLVAFKPLPFFDGSLFWASIPGAFVLIALSLFFRCVVYPLIMGEKN